MKIADILAENDRMLVITHYRLDADGKLYNGGGPPQNPACFLQICLLRSKISPSGKYIRLGESKGDEIMGWTNIEALEVDEILGRVADDGVTVVPISASILEAA